MRDCAKSGLVLLGLAFAGIAIAGRQGGTDNTIENHVERTPIPTKVVYEFSRTVGRGRLVKATAGKPGELIRTYQLSWTNGKLVSKTLVRTERIEPEPTRFLMGSSGVTSSRHSFTRSRVVAMRATAYPPNPGHPWSSTPSHTATGRPAQFGLVAVDPHYIPLGTHLFIEGYGYALAADTGGAIRGNRIDLCLPNERLCRQFGRRQVRVHILK